jgi:hypothetical protein
MRSSKEKQNMETMDGKRFVHVHLAIPEGLAGKFDAICAEWRLKRPWALERLVDREYKAIMRKRDAAFPTVAEVERKIEGAG